MQDQTTHKKLKAFIVEDDLAWLKKISRILGSDENIHLVGSSNDIDEAIEKIKGHELHLLFLDIEVQDRYGWEIFDHFPNPPFKIIFITAHKKHYERSIVENLGFHAIHKAQFSEAILRGIVNKFVEHNKDVQKIKIDLLNRITQDKNWVTLTYKGSGGSMVHTPVQLDSIICIEYIGAEKVRIRCIQCTLEVHSTFSDCFNNISREGGPLFIKIDERSSAINFNYCTRLEGLVVQMYCEDIFDFSLVASHRGAKSLKDHLDSRG